MSTSAWARVLCAWARVLSASACAARATFACQNGEREQNGDKGNPPARHAHLLLGLALLPLNMRERFARMSSVAAGLDDRYENIMREFHPAGVVAVLIGEEPAV